MFQRIHLSALLSLTAQFVKEELSVSTGISRLTSISTPLAGEAFTVCLCVYICMCVSKCIPLRGLGSQASWLIYHPWHHQCAVWRREKMEGFTSCKHAPSCQSAPVRLAWFTRIEKGLRRGEEKTRTEKRSSFNPATMITCLRGKKEETMAINLRWMFVLTGSGSVGTILMISLVICWTLA